MLVGRTGVRLSQSVRLHGTSPFREHVLRGACSVFLIFSIRFVSSELRVGRAPKSVFASSLQTLAERWESRTSEGKVEALGGNPA